MALYSLVTMCLEKTIIGAKVIEIIILKVVAFECAGTFWGCAGTYGTST